MKKVTKEGRYRVMAQLTTTGKQHEVRADKVRCECEDCGVHSFREPLHRPGGQCKNCGSYALRVLGRDKSSD